MSNLLKFLKLTTVFFIVLTLSILQGCYTVESLPIGTAQFSFSSSTDDNGRAENIEDAAYVVVTLLDQGGSPVLASEEISLYNFSGSLISETISLPVGTYSLTEYNILDAAFNVIFAVPLDGSELDYLVDSPLPISVSVVANTTTKISPQVLSTTGLAPEDFGFTSFGFNEAETIEFLAVAQIYDSNPLILNWILTAANIDVTDGTNTIYSGTLAALTNHVTVPGDYANYVVTVSKTGFTSQQFSLTKAELEAFYNNPMIISLQ